MMPPAHPLVALAAPDARWWVDTFSISATIEPSLRATMRTGPGTTAGSEPDSASSRDWSPVQLQVGPCGPGGQQVGQATDTSAAPSATPLRSRPGEERRTRWCISWSGLVSSDDAGRLTAAILLRGRSS